MQRLRKSEKKRLFSRIMALIIKDNVIIWEKYHNKMDTRSWKWCKKKEFHLVIHHWLWQ